MEHLEIQISGTIQKSNFPTWKNSLLKQINAINLELITDNDFAVATENAKLLKKAEKAIQEAKIRAIEQTEEIQKLFDALDEVSEKARQSRLSLDRQIRARKNEIKDELIKNSIIEVENYINNKPEIFTRLNNSKYLQRHQYELAIKGKSSIVSVRNSLKYLVGKIKATINGESAKIVHNYKIIEEIPATNRLLFQDINNLVTLPEKELELTIENRIVKFSEQNAIKNAEHNENRFNESDNEVLTEFINRKPDDSQNQNAVDVKIYNLKPDLDQQTSKHRRDISDGYIYVLSNESMPSVYKIGNSKKGGEERAKELYRGNTALPSKFIVEYEKYSNVASDLELLIHAELFNYRVSVGREFFRIDLRDILLICDRYVEILDKDPSFFDKIYPQSGTEWTEKDLEVLARHGDDPDYSLLSTILGRTPFQIIMKKINNNKT